MKANMKLFHRFWPYLCLFVLVFILFLTNFEPETFLTGWDNLHTEFAPLLNLERAWQAVWQEYQGLGLLAGMAHGAEFMRQLIFLPLMLLLPSQLFRYAFHFLALLFGVWGMFAFLLYILRRQKTLIPKPNLLSFLGASFYLLNLGTLQNFYLPYESFSMFYAVLPWLILFALKIIHGQRKKDVLIFALISLIASAAFYVQTIFVVYFAILLIILLIFLLTNRQKNKWQKTGLILGLTILINAFWLLPNLYFVLTNHQVVVDAKNNQMATEQITLRNDKFGIPTSILRLQGYWFDYTDFNQSGSTVYLLDSWKTHLDQPVINVLSYLPALFVLGALFLLFIYQPKKNLFREEKWLVLMLFLTIYFVLNGSNPPTAWLYELLKQHLPLFGQIFRSGFTKWVVPAAFTYSFALTLFFALLFIYLQKFLWQHMVLVFGFLLSLILVMYPAFQGHFVYSRLRVQIPEAYFELFDYFKTVPESSRIANLPQHSFYSWQWNDWGYRGSGFLWYGIKQPILDRAFDVWSKADENYYWELQTALDQKDVKTLEAVLSKYDVDYLLLDTSIINRNTTKPFDYEAIKDLLADSSKMKLVKEFDFISLYAFNDVENSREKEFVTLYDHLPIINNSYEYSWSDQAYLNFHDYLSVINNNAHQARIIYPFASLFTNHQQQDFEFHLDEDQEFFYLSSQKAITTSNLALQIPKLLETESVLPFRLTWQVEENQLKLHLEALLPEIFYGNRKFYFDFNKEIILDAKLCQKNQQENDCYLNINNQLFGLLSQSGQIDLLLNTKTTNVLALSKANKIEYFDYFLLDLGFFDLTPKELQTQENINFTVKIPKVMVQTDLLKTELNTVQAQNCRSLAQGSVVKEQRADGNYYEAIDASACDSFFLEQLSHQASYLFRLDVQNLRSIPFIFAVQVESLGRSPLETYLSEGVNYLILPPIENFNRGYTLYLSTDSYGREINDNLLKKAEVFAWPYNFLSQLYLQDQSTASSQATFSSCDYQVKKRALWFYEVDFAADCQTKYLKLSQAYDQGWLAMQDHQLLDHEKFNNWANVWLLDEVDDQAKIYLFFWPQLFQHLGFGLLLVVICLIYKSKKAT